MMDLANVFKTGLMSLRALAIHTASSFGMEVQVDVRHDALAKA
jgi:hypothetical protein